jgi:hypothetical protein
MAFAVLTGAGFIPASSKPIKAVVATLLLLAGLLPFGFGHIEWETWLITAIQIAAIAAFVVLTRSTYSPKRGQQRPNR